MEYSLKAYYARYLTDVRQLSNRTAKHYEESLRWISEHLKSKGLLEDCIYEVLDTSKVLSFREILKSDREFIELDKRGHQMYSAGLNNYISFIEGSAFAKFLHEIDKIDIPIGAPNPSMKHGKVIWPISPIIKQQSIAIADFTCEIDACHKTFTAKGTMHQYMEGHHIIPMTKQLSFPNSLDIFANLVCVCPNCHRMLHHAIDS